MAKGRMRDMNIKTDDDRIASQAAEEIEKESFKDVLTMEKFVDVYTDKILDGALPAQPSA